MASLGHKELNQGWWSFYMNCFVTTFTNIWHISTLLPLVPHLCVGVGSDNGLSPIRRQAIIWTNAEILLTEPLRTKFSEISIEIHTFWFKKMHLKIWSAKLRPFCPRGDELTNIVHGDVITDPWPKFHWSLFLKVQLTISLSPPPATKAFAMLVPKFEKHHIFAVFGEKSFFNQNHWFLGPVEHPFLTLYMLNFSQGI